MELDREDRLACSLIPGPYSLPLLRFLVIRVLAAGIAELRELQTAGGRLLVLRRRVVPVLALGALQCDNFAHLSILTDFAGFHRPTKFTLN
jgi:hypothetical protein